MGDRRERACKALFCLAAGAFVALFCAASAHAEDAGIKLSAKIIRTWSERGERLFLLEKNARIEAPGGAVTGDSMVIWFDEKASRKEGLIRLTVYSESQGAGSITTLEAAGPLSFDDRALLAFAPPTTSDVLKRAKDARAAAQEAQAQTGAAASPKRGRVVQPPSALTAVPSTPSVEALAPTAVAPAITPTFESTASLVPPVMESTAPAVEPQVESTAPAVIPQVESTTPAVTPQVESTAPAIVPQVESTAPAVAPQVESTAHAAAPVIESTAPRAAKPPLSLFEGIEEEEALDVKYGPTSTKGYHTETVKVDSRNALAVTGGIEITFGKYSMRADNMVIFFPVEDAPSGTGFQIYAEGNVRFTVPPATIEGSQVFYDYDSNRATLVNAGVYARLARNGAPLVMRADRIRALSGGEYEATNASVTTCEFGDPHYRVAMRRVTVTPIKNAAGEDSAMLVSQGNRVYVGPVPALAWPRISRDIKDTHIPLRRLQVGSSTQFGFYTYTRWDMLDLLAGNSADSWAARTSKWADIEAALDYRSDRGPATGLDFAYAKEDVKGVGLLYYINDHGTDSDGFKAPSDDRGRAWWQQRAFADELQIDTELSYISDRGFLPEYYEQEFKEGKEQETYVYLKRPWEHSQVEFLVRPTLNNFQTQTEYLPQARYDVVGMPLLDNRLVYTSVTRADNVTEHFDNALALRDYNNQRFDTLHQFDLPLSVPSGFTVTPFTTFRGTYFDDTVNTEAVGRYAGSVGSKFGLPPVSRVYDVDSSLFDIHRLRHTAIFDVTYEDVYDSSRQPRELLQFDEIEQVRELQVATPRLSQRLQTKRAGLEPGDPARTVDLALFDIEADLFPESNRDNDGRTWSDVRYFGRLNVTDDVSVVGEGKYDTYDERLDRANVWLRVDHSPRTSWAVGNGYIRGISQSVFTFRIDHEINERWGFAALTQYDYQSGQNLTDEVIIRRNMHEFALDFYSRYNKGNNETTFGVNLYPLGMFTRRPTFYQ